MTPCLLRPSSSRSTCTTGVSVQYEQEGAASPLIRPQTVNVIIDGSKPVCHHEDQPCWWMVVEVEVAVVVVIHMAGRVRKLSDSYTGQHIRHCCETCTLLGWRRCRL